MRRKSRRNSSTRFALLAPFGQANRKPLFVSRSVPLRGMDTMGQEKQHLKLHLRAEGINHNDLVQGILWNQSALFSALENVDSLDVCYRRTQCLEWKTQRANLCSKIPPAEW